MLCQSTVFFVLTSVCSQMKNQYNNDNEARNGHNTISFAYINMRILFYIYKNSYKTFGEQLYESSKNITSTPSKHSQTDSRTRKMKPDGTISNPDTSTSNPASKFGMEFGGFSEIYLGGLRKNIISYLF